MHSFEGCIDRLREIIGDFPEGDGLQGPAEITIDRSTLSQLWAQADRELNNVYWAGQEEHEDMSPNNTRALTMRLFEIMWTDPQDENVSAPDIMITAIKLAKEIRKEIPHDPSEF